jgi:HTH-type transcriptional regulator/antitoxin HigA
MEIVNIHTQVNRLLPAWETFRNATDIAPIRDEAHYERMVAMLEALLDEVSGDENHPAMGLVDIVGDLIEDYETAHHPLPATTGVQALKFLMEQYGLKQSDLPEIGSQGVVSEILTGKRDLNIRQVRALSERFGVSPATFV